LLPNREQSLTKEHDVRKSFTDKFVRHATPVGDRQTDYWDQTLNGFGLRVSPTGKKTFQIYYRHNRRQRRFAIGRYSLLSLADARKLAKQYLADVCHGIDPATARSVSRNAETFGQLVTEYLHAKRQLRSLPEFKRIAKKELLPHWKSRKARDITRRDVQELVHRIDARNAPIMANRTLGLIRQIFNHAVDNAWFDVNPTQRITKPGTERKRDRFLKPEEIAHVWRVLETDKTTEATIMQLQLLTGQRIGELRRMQRVDVNLKTGWWEIPAQFAKNDTAHRVPLSPEVQEILKPLLSVRKERWVFPMPRDASRPLAYANIHFALRRIKGKLSMESWSTHDLRRTVATHIAQAGVGRLVIMKILNHKDSGQTGVYDRHNYEIEASAALTAWGRRVMAMITEEEEEASNLLAFEGRK
jgi:integrase